MTLIEQVREALEAAESYFGNRADAVDGPYGQPAPNSEAVRHSECSRALAALQKLERKVCGERPHTTHYDASEHHHDDCGCQSERLRKELAAAQAQIVALREALGIWHAKEHYCCECGTDSATHDPDCRIAALSHPPGTEALRALLEQAWANGCGTAEDASRYANMSKQDVDDEMRSDIARILGESGVANG